MVTRKVLRDLLQENGGNITQTAVSLGVSRPTIYRWLDFYGLGVDRGSVTNVRWPWRSNSRQTAAIQAVGKAVRDGRLTRQSCEECGKDSTEAHHHNGYSKEHELDVRWLCHSHHQYAHHKRS